MATYLTKSRYSQGRECPTKLYYQSRRREYGDKRVDDAFLKALAQGGFQVGELAKIYNPGGLDIETLDHQEALQLTASCLKAEEAVVYEGAFQAGSCFVRVDVLRKKGHQVDLVEVKAKSFDPELEDPFWHKPLKKKGLFKLNKSWEPYLYDVAFQTWVVRQAHPDWSVHPYLLLANKNAVATVDGLNQMFEIVKVNGRTMARPVGEVRKEETGSAVLVEVDVKEVVDMILEDRIVLDPGQKTFREEIQLLETLVENGSKHPPRLSGACKNCEFRIEAGSEIKSGFHECWEGVKRSEDERNGPFVFDIWNLRNTGKWIDQGKFLARQLHQQDLNPTRKADAIGFSQSERQWEQVRAIQHGTKAPTILYPELATLMASWKYPLHFIDFETTMVALPFHQGRRPYEQIAFQFSHHMMDESGRIWHAGEFLHRERGIFPNFDFVRALKAELEADHGTIFRYAAHENTVLCQIYAQLQESKEPDRDELCAWIQTITQSTDKMEDKWVGERTMVDLCEIVKKTYFHPRMGGSNSIKKVLPAILHDSKRLQEKYAQSIYGTAELPSRNFRDFRWIQRSPDGSVLDPYKLLPEIFDGVDTRSLDLLLDEEDNLADGAAAMMAYAKMQFSAMSQAESEAVAAALLKYCELDTLAMVMLYEYWAEILSSSKNRKVV